MGLEMLREGDGRLRVAAGIGASALVAILCLSPSAHAAKRERCDFRRVRTDEGTWTRVPVPSFDALEADSRGLSAADVGRFRVAVDERSSRHLFLADDYFVYETTNGGCGWNETYAMGDPLGPAGARPVTAPIVAAPGGASVAAYVLVTRMNDEPVLAARGRASGDWRESLLIDSATRGPIVGTPLRLWIAPSDPNVLYAALSVDGATEWQGDAIRLYRSDDAGVSWTRELAYVLPPLQEPATSPAWWITDASCLAGSETCSFVDPRRMEVDPRDPLTLWTANSNGVFRSKDGGSSWTNVYPVTQASLGSIGALDVAHDARRPARIAVFGSQGVAWSDDGGTVWNLEDPVRGYSPAGQKVAAPIESVASSTADEVVAVLAPSASSAGANAMLLHSRAWAPIGPSWLTCPTSGERPYDRCLARVSYSSHARAYYCVRNDGREVDVFKPSRVDHRGAGE